MSTPYETPRVYELTVEKNARPVHDENNNGG